MTKNTKKNDTALIGCGYWGTNIAKVLTKIKKNKIIIYDENRSNSIILNKRFPDKTTISKSLKNILHDKNTKNIILATPPEMNYRLLKQCIENKKNIFIEKPGLKNYSEIMKIKKMKNSKILMFGYIYLFNNNIKYLKKYITAKKNGKILYINFQRQNLGPIRNDVSASYDLSSHDLSIFLYLFNKLPKIIRDTSYSILKKNISDISNLSLKYKNFFVDINNNWLSPDKIRRITIITNKKMLLFNEMLSDNKIKIYNKYAKYPKISEFDNKFFNKKAKIYLGKNYSPKITQNDSLLDELKYFFKCVKRNSKPVTDIEFASKILKILSKVS